MAGIEAFIAELKALSKLEGTLLIAALIFGFYLLRLVDSINAQLNAIRELLQDSTKHLRMTYDDWRHEQWWEEEITDQKAEED
jgi:hypothetical protein